MGVNAQLDKGWSRWANLGYLWSSQSYSGVVQCVGARYTWSWQAGHSLARRN